MADTLVSMLPSTDTLQALEGEDEEEGQKEEGSEGNEEGFEGEEEEEKEEEGDEESVQSSMSSIDSSEEVQKPTLIQTVLFVPPEATSRPIDIVSRDKEVCARLEAEMVDWIRQMKEVINNRSIQDIDVWYGPLDEVLLWETRSQNLIGLIAQLRSKKVRTVQQIMAIIKSPFIKTFSLVTSEILNASEEAISNLKYLQRLVDPCTKLHLSKVIDIPDQLENLLSVTWDIWMNSPFYNTRERIGGLLRKVSNEIITHCIMEIHVHKVFDGHITSAEAGINQCISCLKSWKDKYFEAERYHHQNSNLSWMLEYDHIFSHVDAFLHRLNNLLEICMGQRIFARRVDGFQEPMPVYPGPKAAEAARVMTEVQNLFDKTLLDIHPARHLVLNVKNSDWHEYILMYKDAVKEIKKMIQKLLSSCFESVTNVEDGIKILETFFIFYQKDVITRVYNQLITKLYQFFEDEAGQVSTLFTRNLLPIPHVNPRLTGRAAWAFYLQHRVDIRLQHLDEATWLPECGYGDDIKEQAKLLSKTLGEFANTVYKEWETSLGTRDLTSHLGIPLMAISTTHVGMIEDNFDKGLRKHIIEAQMWAKMGYEIPTVLQNIYFDRDRLHMLRETVLLVVNDYNAVVSALSPEERLLFKGRIKVIDRKVYPGLTKLTWDSDFSDSYIRDCRQAASKVQGFTDEYKNANIKIAKLAIKMSKHLIVKIDLTRVYERNEFNDYQDQRRSTALLKIAKKYKNITVILRSLYEMFETDGPEVHVQWMKYLTTIDKIVEDALLLNVRKSLEALLKAINGDGSGPPAPIFKLKIILYQNKLSFYPSIPTLEDMILGTPRWICITIRPFPRVLQFLTDDIVPFAQVISKDEVARGTIDQIAEVMRPCIIEVEKFLQEWEAYRDVWELDKTEFMTRYERQNPSIQSYETDIARYAELLYAIEEYDSEFPIGFCIMDCSMLKDTIAEHCKDWISVFKQGLHALKEELNESLSDRSF